MKQTNRNSPLSFQNAYYAVLFQCRVSKVYSMFLAHAFQAHQCYNFSLDYVILSF